MSIKVNIIVLLSKLGQIRKFRKQFSFIDLPWNLLVILTSRAPQMYAIWLKQLIVL